nr:DMT family transporter [Glaciecola sp. MH2013]
MVLALIGTFLFSLKPIVIKYAYALALTSEQVITLRMLIALPIYLIIALLAWQRKPQRRKETLSSLPIICVLGVLGYFLASYLDLLGLQYISAQLERVVLFSFPTIVVVMSWIFFKTPMQKKTWLLLAMSYAGILVIFGHDLSVLGSQVSWGTLLVFISAVCFAVYVLWSKPVISKVGSQMFTSIAMLAASLVIIVLFLTNYSVADLHVSNHAYLIITILSVFCTVIPSLLVAEAIHRIGPERTSIVGTCGPAMTSVIAVFVLNEAFTIFHGIGLVLVMLAVGLMMKKPKESQECDAKAVN